MPTNPRIHPVGVPLHVVQRGHNREPCFFDDDDRRFYLYWLHDALVRFEVQLHAYALMSNHVHLLVTPQKTDAVPAAAISIGRRYVQYINKKYRRTGTLWDGRYKASPIDNEGYLLACYRYIELNPVRAGLVSSPADYVWSSYRFNALGEQNVMVTPRVEYLSMGRSASDRRHAYRELVAEVLDAASLADIRLALRLNRALGPSIPAA